MIEAEIRYDCYIFSERQVDIISKACKRDKLGTNASCSLHLEGLQRDCHLHAYRPCGSHLRMLWQDLETQLVYSNLPLLEFPLEF